MKTKVFDKFKKIIIRKANTVVKTYFSIKKLQERIGNIK